MAHPVSARPVNTKASKNTRCPPVPNTTMTSGRASTMRPAAAPSQATRLWLGGPQKNPFPKRSMTFRMCALQSPLVQVVQSLDDETA